AVTGLQVTFDEGAGLDLDVLVEDIAGHPRRTREHDLLGLDPAFDDAGEFDRFAMDRALHPRAVADGHRDAAHVAVDFAVDADVLGALELARDLERAADDGYARRGGPHRARYGLRNGLTHGLWRRGRRLRPRRVRRAGIGGFVVAIEHGH